MPEIESYTFNHKELIELLIKASNIHEGEWQLQVNFGFTAGNFGPDGDNVFPGSIVILNNVGLTRAKPDSPKPLVLDAAKVNPRRST